MQFLIVRLGGKSAKKKIAVLINGEKNGYVNELLMLNRGWIEVSVDLPKAKIKEIELKNTTRQKPMEVVI
jgi:hypothetical protein